MALAKVNLDDKYDLAQDRIYVTGSQAVVRLAHDAARQWMPRAG